MTGVADRFADRMRDHPQEWAVPELLPARQDPRRGAGPAGVAGAGMSLLAGPGMQTPLGASDGRRGHRVRGGFRARMTFHPAQVAVMFPGGPPKR